MSDKVFYQAAASEVAQGVIDQALWIKVSADMAGSDKVTRQAKYIQLRARELSNGHLEKVLKERWLPRALRIVKWAVVALAVFWILFAVGDYFGGR